MNKKSELKKLLKNKLILISLLATSLGALTGCPSPENNNQTEFSTKTSTVREYTPDELEELNKERNKYKAEEQKEIEELIKANGQSQEEEYYYDGKKLTKEEYQKILIDNPATCKEESEEYTRSLNNR